MFMPYAAHNSVYLSPPTSPLYPNKCALILGLSSISLTSAAMFATTLMLTVSLAATVALADDYVKCETTDGSPNLKGCQDLSTGFQQGADPDCAQPYGSGCRTTASNNEGCAFVLCMQDGTEPQCSDPASAGKFTQQLIDQCGKDGKVGGYYHQDLGDGHYLNYEFTNP